MNGLYNSYLLIAMPLFIFVANIMNASGVIERLLGFGAAMVGHLPGGLAQVNVVSNLVFSGMSGSAVADASGPGLIVARMMTKNGRYPAGFAAATSVASATLGPLMPTSIPMIFYALIANVSVGAMLIGGLVPALMQAAALMGVVALTARRRNFPREKMTPWNEVPAVLARAILPLVLPGLLIGLIYSGVTTPTEAAAIAAAYALIIAFLVYRSLEPGALLAVIGDTVRATAMIAMIMAGAFVFNYAVANENVPQLISSTFVAWHLSPIAFLFCVDLLMLVLAVVLDEVTILLVIVPSSCRSPRARRRSRAFWGAGGAQHDGRPHASAARAVALRDAWADRHAPVADLPRDPALHPGDARNRHRGDLDARIGALPPLGCGPHQVSARLGSRLVSANPRI